MSYIGKSWFSRIVGTSDGDDDDTPETVEARQLAQKAAATGFPYLDYAPQDPNYYLQRTAKWVKDLRHLHHDDDEAT